jgi:ankyrin repeat protein
MNQEWKAATQQGDVIRVRVLLEQGMDINARDEHGQTALMNAAHAGQEELVRLLIEKGADLNVTAKYHLSALMLALIAHHPELARILIEAGADIHVLGSDSFAGATALDLAERGDYTEIVALLTQRGAITRFHGS